MCHFIHAKCNILRKIIVELCRVRPGKLLSEMLIGRSIVNNFNSWLKLFFLISLLLLQIYTSDHVDKEETAVVNKQIPPKLPKQHALQSVHLSYCVISLFNNSEIAFVGFNLRFHCPTTTIRNSENRTKCCSDVSRTNKYSHICEYGQWSAYINSSKQMGRTISFTFILHVPQSACCVGLCFFPGIFHSRTTAFLILEMKTNSTNIFFFDYMNWFH